MVAPWGPHALLLHQTKHLATARTFKTQKVLMAAWSLPNRTLLTEPEPHRLPWNSPRPESRSKLVKRRGEAPWNGRRPSRPGNVWTWCSDPLRSTRPPSTLLFTMSRGFPTKQTTLAAVHPSQLRPGGNLLIWLPRSLSKKKKKSGYLANHLRQKCQAPGHLVGLLHIVFGHLRLHLRLAFTSTSTGHLHLQLWLADHLHLHLHWPLAPRPSCSQLVGSRTGCS